MIFGKAPFDGSAQENDSRSQLSFVVALPGRTTKPIEDLATVVRHSTTPGEQEGEIELRVGVTGLCQWSHDAIGIAVLARLISQCGSVKLIGDGRRLIGPVNPI